MGRDLFDGSGSDDAEEISKIEVNEEFARRYEHNKKREDLHRLEELVKSGRVSSSAAAADGTSDDDSDDDEEDLAGSETEDLQFYEALVKVKKIDPAVLADKDAKLFDWEEKEGKEKEKRPKKERPLYLKDVNARNLLEGGPEFDEDETFSKKNQKSYSEEQDEIRREFLEAAEETFDGGDDDLLIEKKRIEEGPGDNVEIQERLNEYFGEDENLNENERFLKSFLVNKMWVDKEKGRRPAEEEVLEVSEDEEELEKQEKYEAKYNFRYEEGVGDRILGHARFMEGSVRKKENARKTQRKSKEDRLAQAEVERREELKRLKNVKKKEIMEKLEKIRAIAGIGEGVECVLDEEDLEEEFDPDEYDRRMRETFGDGYYEANDADPDFKSDEEGDVEKPDFDKEDELLGLPKGWDVLSSGDGFSKVREKVLKRKQSEAVKEDGEAQEEEEEEEEEEEDVEGKKKRKISLHDKVDLEKELEEYYKLDYEDTIGDLKTRFKYKSVPSNRYGLSGQEILMMEDKDLNQYVSLKKLAPYREDEWKIPRAKRYQQKKMKHVILQGGKLPDKKEKKKKKKGEDAGKSQLEKPDGEVGVESKRSRKRHRQSELKLSQSRLLAYGITQPENKAKKKH